MAWHAVPLAASLERRAWTFIHTACPAIAIAIALPYFHSLIPYALLPHAWVVNRTLEHVIESIVHVTTPYLLFLQNVQTPSIARTF
jgi:hypothetical protein